MASVNKVILIGSLGSRNQNSCESTLLGRGLGVAAAAQQDIWENFSSNASARLAVPGRQVGANGHAATHARGRRIPQKTLPVASDAANLTSSGVSAYDRRTEILKMQPSSRGNPIGRYRQGIYVPSNLADLRSSGLSIRVPNAPEEERFSAVRDDLPLRSNRMAGKRIGRDAGSGQFIPVREAQRNPGRSVVETLPAHSPTGPTTRVGRDARSGEFIPVREAERRPGTTTVETVPRRK